MKCNYGVAWVGKCENEVPCNLHKDRVCSSCGEKATHECDATSIFVCGCDLCDNCEHMINEKGFNEELGPKSHCRKGAQKYLPWYARPN